MHFVGGGVLGARERVEDSLKELRRHAVAIVLDLDAQMLQRIGMRREPDEAQPDATALRGVLHGVRQQVQQNLVEMRLVADETLVADGADFRAERLALVPGHGRDDGFRGGQRVAQVELRQGERRLAALDLRDVQHVVDEVEQMAPRGHDLAGAVAHLGRVVGLLLDDGGEAEHGVHGSADVVGHVGEEGRFRLVGHLGRPKRLGELLGVQRALLLPRPLGPGLLAPVEAVQDDAQAEGRNRDGGHHDQGDVHRLGLALDGLHGHITHQIGGAVAD